MAYKFNQESARIYPTKYINRKDDEAMDIMAKLGEFVNRKGIYPPLPDADKIQFVQMYSFGKKEYEEKKKEYQKIFQ